MKKLFILFTLSFLATTTFAQDLKFLLKDGIILQMRKYDSAAVKTAINAKMSYTDTSGMLSAYRSSANNKVGYTDTSTMLSAYSTATNARLKYTDTASLLSAYSTAINTKQDALGFTPYNSTNPSSYITSSAISGKVNYTDTTSMLSAYGSLINSRVKYTDTSGMLSAYSTAINTKQNTLVAGTDYLTPTGSAASLTSFPTLNQNTTGTAAGLTTGRTISISGDLAYTSPTFNGTSNVSAAGTLATVNSNVGSFGSATQVPSYTVNAKGLITAASNTTIQIPESQVTNLTTDLASKQGSLTLTTTGTSGAATLVGNTLNIPSYSGGGGSLNYSQIKLITNK